MIGWLKSMFSASEPGNRDPFDDFWYTDLPGGMTTIGTYITPTQALKVPAVRNCLQALADPIGTLPLKIYRRERDGNKTMLDEHPLGAVLRNKPNENSTGYEFRGQMQWNLGLHNNAYAEIRPGPLGAISELVLLNPTQTRAKRATDRAIWYETTDRNASRRMIPASEMLHIKALPLSDDGLCGCPRINDAADTVAQALAVQNYGARYFRNSGQTGGILEHPGQFKDSAARDTFLRAWRAARTGANQHRDAVLEYGIKYNRGEMKNNTAQFLETRKALAVEIAQIWRVPPHKIGILDEAKWANIEQQALEFVTDTLLPWLVAWEQAIKRDLILEPDVYAEFNVLGLLRGDIKTRYDAYAAARNWGWLSVNDIRRLENMNPIVDGDTYLQPLNMAPAGDPQQPSAIKIYQSITDYEKERAA